MALYWEMMKVTLMIMIKMKKMMTMMMVMQVWDLRKMALYWETNVGNGVCGVEWDRRDIEVIVIIIIAVIIIIIIRIIIIFLMCHWYHQYQDQLAMAHNMGFVASSGTEGTLRSLSLSMSCGQ